MDMFLNFLYKINIRYALILDRWVAPFYSFLFKKFRIIHFDQKVNLSQSLCVFAHFDREGSIEPYVFYLLNHIKEAGFDICFVSAAPELKKENLSALAPLARWVILKPNRGSDFTSWSVGLYNSMRKSQYNKILLLNDSIYGPFFDLKPWLNSIGTESKTIYGITDSFHRGYHLESFCLGYGKDIIESDFFKKFWKNIHFFKFHENVIRLYEQSLGRIAQKEGLNLNPLIPLKKIAQDNAEALLVKKPWISGFNLHTHILFEKHRCPFISRKCFYQGHQQLDELQFKKFLDHAGSLYPFFLIEKDLLRQRETLSVISN